MLFCGQMGENKHAIKASQTVALQSSIKLNDSFLFFWLAEGTAITAKNRSPLASCIWGYHRAAELLLLAHQCYPSWSCVLHQMVRVSIEAGGVA